MKNLKSLANTRLALGILSLVVSSHSGAANFGKDDRQMISPWTGNSTVARSTAVAVLNSLIEETSPGKFKLMVENTSSFLCSDEKFYNKPSLPYACSGFLVAPDLLVTAGHCMVNHGETRNETGMYCESYSSWVFDYALNRAGRPQTENIPADNHYKCKQIIYAVSDKNNDYALIQLDRPVKGRKPLKMVSAPVSSQEFLKMIGHPFGLPSVLSHNARVIEDLPERNYFVTTLDAFEGNSGSGVLNSKNEIVGILIGGTPSANTVDDKVKGCSRHNYCDEKGENCLLPDEKPELKVGSDVQRIAPIIKLVNEFNKNRTK